MEFQHPKYVYDNFKYALCNMTISSPLEECTGFLANDTLDILGHIFEDLIGKDVIEYGWSIRCVDQNS